MTNLRYAGQMLKVKRLRTQALAVLLAALAALPGPAPANPVADLYDETCTYFSNAAFRDRRIQGATTFRMQLAQDCVDAMLYARAADPSVRARAIDYLQDLEAYRGLLIAMIMRRARDRGQGEAWEQLSWRPAVSPVSEAGAYLIARDLGLVDTHRDWTDWRRAAALPLFRLDTADTR